MAVITDLALEVLQEIVSLLPHTRPTQDPPPTSFNSTEVGYPLKEITDRYRKIAPLRTVCRAFDDAVQPILFSEVVIDCLHTRLDIVQSQFESLSSGSGPWRRYAGSLKILNLDPCYDRRPSSGGIQYWMEYFSEEQRNNAYKMEELIKTRLIPSIQTGFPNLEAVSWFVRRSDPIQELTSYLATVKTLRSLTLVFWSDRVIRDFPLDSFSNLCRISLFFFNDNNMKRMDDIWYRDARRLLQRLHLLVESSPEMAALKIGKMYRERQRSEEDLEIPLFPLDFLLTPAAKQLCHLSLRRFDLVQAGEDTMPGDYYTHLTKNLTSLTSLDLTECDYYTCPALWNAICDSNILLSSIKVDYFTAGLVKYLHRPDLPLRSLTLVLHRFSLYEDIHWDEAGDLAVLCFTTVLEAHKDTLQTLDFQVMPQYLWWLEVEKPANGEAQSDPQRPSQIARRIYLEDTSLLRCKELRKLSVTLDLRKSRVLPK
ncbi:hypothetical protein FA13DRAFT_718811 [Coprinellus micaceus]|uniref:Uncharacterized protein n=1 Tax=Coprinellus micaceus TaxID=71717 RepID=A0A4Y7TV55_COPMI|nr:hypothetical protein FA13DRAFT_718811 [Coprinellus micaceus]